MEQAKQIANYLHGLGNEKDADYVMFMAASIENDELHITRLVKERDELTAQVERLRKGLEDALCLEAESAGPSSDWHPELHHAVDALNETPTQSLAAVRADTAFTAYVEGYMDAQIEPEEADCGEQSAIGAEAYAQRIRNGEV